MAFLVGQKYWFQPSEGVVSVISIAISGGFGLSPAPVVISLT